MARSSGMVVEIPTHINQFGAEITLKQGDSILLLSPKALGELAPVLYAYAVTHGYIRPI
jgi:hypothetical protein